MRNENSSQEQKSNSQAHTQDFKKESGHKAQTQKTTIHDKTHDEKVSSNPESISAESESHHQEKHNPLAQFEVKKIVDLSYKNIDLSITNSAFYMIISTVLIIAFMLFSTRKQSLVPSRLQVAAESIYGFIFDLIEGSIGQEGRKFFPLVFSLFSFILACNCLGMTPYSFTATSQIAVTISLAMTAFLTITIFAIVRNGFVGFLHMFLPSGVPLWMAPVIFIIELFSFLIRPITLSVRLFANMVAGHVLLKVVAGFIISLGLIFGTVPFLFNIIMTGFEFFVAALQAYIFAILVCAYLSETTKAH